MTTSDDYHPAVDDRVWASYHARRAEAIAARDRAARSTQRLADIET